MKNKPLKILFDANPLVNQKSGIGYYTYQLVESLAKFYPEEIQLVGHYFNFLGRKSPKLPNYPNIRYKSSKILPGKILSILRRIGLQLPFETLIKERGDIALFTNFVSLPTIFKIKKVVAIHDLCFEEHPEYLQPANLNFLKKFVPQSAEKADLIITISESTKLAIKKHYKVDEDKIIITPIPPAQPITKKVPKPKDLDIPSSYILVVSTLEPRKNYLNLIRAYSMLPDNILDKFGLVLAGGIGWDNDECLSEIDKQKKEGKKIVLTGYIDEDTRTYLYQNASMFVMPSHYEGFGMPILEAMSYGVPVAASDILVFHEVAGDAALYFDKDDPADIASNLLKILTDNSLRNQLIKKSAIQLKKYYWEKSANVVLIGLKKIS